VLAAEVASGRRLVQVGFMRRFDAGYLRMKAALDSGAIGGALLLHCIHRNPAVPPAFTSDLALTDSVIHEIDAARWLLGEEIVGTTVVRTRRGPFAAGHLADPQLVLLVTGSGVVVEVEVFLNCRYGYDVRCEIVGGRAERLGPVHRHRRRRDRRRAADVGPGHHGGAGRAARALRLTGRPRGGFLYRAPGGSGSTGS
jgi:myo-inositol 2-dehydrogenase/D-chiro-inositol 1-dehydrogenase